MYSLAYMNGKRPHAHAIIGTGGPTGLSIRSRVIMPVTKTWSTAVTTTEDPNKNIVFRSRFSKRTGQCEIEASELFGLLGMPSYLKKTIWIDQLRTY
jgi:hypothetical protein